MGHRNRITIYTLDKIKDEDGLVVRMKSIRLGKLRKIIATVDDLDSADDSTLDEVINLLAGGLVSWNLVDEDDQPIPADKDGLDELELPTALAIVSSWIEAVTGVEEELGKDSPSGGNFPGQPLTMATL